MTDQELTALAALAYGSPPAGFSPLTDDGDALRLAVRLGIDIEWDEQPAGRTVEAYQRGEESCFCATEAEADYRRAIVRAAAAIGEAMP